MPCILHIETSTSVCSVALSIDGQLLFNKESFEGLSHASLLGLFAEEAMQCANAKGLKPDAVAVSSGPGSYTGLRIGLSFAKGLCFGQALSLIAIPTLQLLAHTALQRHVADSGALYCPMLDARRMEVYSALYDAQLHPVRETEAEIITAESYRELLMKSEICFFGNGAAKCKPLIDSPNALFVEDIMPLASNMVALAEQRFAEGAFEDVAYFEPFYLKEFQTTVAKNKVLGGVTKGEIGG